MSDTIPRNTLPSAEQLRLAVGQWWKGGGITNLIVNVLRREAATVTEATAVAESLGRKASSDHPYISDDVVTEHLERVRAVAHSQEKSLEEQAKSPSPPVGSAEWHRRATERALRNWGELVGGEMPRDPEEASAAYRKAVYAGWKP